MNEQDLQSEYWGHPMPGLPRELIELAEEYHLETESFDRVICTGEPRHGNAFPNPWKGWEREESNRVARYTMERVKSEARRVPGFTAEDWRKALACTTHGLPPLKGKQ